MLAVSRPTDVAINARRDNRLLRGVVVRPDMLFAQYRAACFVAPRTLQCRVSPSQHKIDMTRIKSATLNIRIDPTLKAAVDKFAADDHRSITSLIEKLLTDYLRANGYLKPAKK